MNQNTNLYVKFLYIIKNMFTDDSSRSHLSSNINKKWKYKTMNFKKNLFYNKNFYFLSYFFRLFNKKNQNPNLNKNKKNIIKKNYLKFSQRFFFIMGLHMVQKSKIYYFLF